MVDHGSEAQEAECRIQERDVQDVEVDQGYQDEHHHDDHFLQPGVFSGLVMVVQAGAETEQQQQGKDVQQGFLAFKRGIGSDQHQQHAGCQQKDQGINIFLHDADLRLFRCPGVVVGQVDAGDAVDRSPQDRDVVIAGKLAGHQIGKAVEDQKIADQDGKHGQADGQSHEAGSDALATMTYGVADDIAVGGKQDRNVRIGKGNDQIKDQYTAGGGAQARDDGILEALAAGDGILVINLEHG